MASEKDKIIAMLEEGTISPDDAAKLLTALGETEHDSAPSVPAQSADPKRAAELKGKKLRVLVEGATDDDGDINVNVAVPLVLAKLVDGIITNVVPKEVNKELKGQGIDLSALKLGEIVDTLTDLDEDIVNVDVKADGNDIKVRVYVE